MQRSNDTCAGLPLEAVLSDFRPMGEGSVQIRSVCGDARQCLPGDTFVALTTADGDGHDEVDLAVRRGATSVITERLLPARLPLRLVPDTREAYGRICHALAGRPSERMQIVGVTGTHGKTTASHLISAVLQAGEAGVGVSTSMGRTGVETVETPRSSLNPAELASWMAQMSSTGATHTVLEASSQGLAERRLAGVEFDAAVLTNVRRDHLDWHGTLKNYRRAKRRLFEQLKPDGFAVVNADDLGSQHILSELTCPVITVGRRELAEVTASIVERHRSEQTFLLSAGNETVPVRTRIIGDHYVTHCLLATAVGLVSGLPLTTIVRGLESIQRMPGRLERVECGQPFGVYLDVAAKPDQLAVCLNALRRVTTGRVICVFGGENNEASTDRAMLGRTAERGSDISVITGNGLREGDGLQEFGYEGIHDILDGYERPARAHVIPTRSQAIQWALDQARDGDSVLIAGNEVYGTCSTPTLNADQQVARRWLYQSASEEPAVIPFPVV